MESKIRHKGTYLTKQKQTQNRQNRLVVAKGDGGWGRAGWEFGVCRCKLLYTERINNKVLLYNTTIFNVPW